MPRSEPEKRPGTRAGTDASSGPGAGSRRRVREAPGVLRCLRRTPGQVRDAARPLPGWRAGDDRLRGVRLQSPDLLPAPRSAGTPRARGSARCTPRSGRPSHLHAGSGRLSPCPARRRPGAADLSVAGPPPAHARGPSASADRGAGHGRRSTKKKLREAVNPLPMRTHASTRGGSAWLEVRPKPNTSGGGPLSWAGTAAKERRARPCSASRVWPSSSHAQPASGRCTVWPRARRAGPERSMHG